MFKQVTVGTLKLNPITKPALLSELKERISSGKKTFLTTLYSEFLYHSLRHRDIKDMLDKADLAIADGIGILWADYFLSRPFSVSNYYLKIIQAWWQVVYTGASILFYPKNLYQTFPEKIVGADLFWDLAKLADENNLSVYLLGGYDDTPLIVKQKLLKQFPNLNIVRVNNKTPHDTAEIKAEINLLKPDMVLVAFGPLVQEKWIVANLENLDIKFVVGLGGTFDYVAGKKSVPPRFVRKVGLEWLYRLITQPQRIVRIYEAVWGLILSLVRYKVFESMPIRPNAMGVVINKNNEVLIVQRNPQDPYLIDTGDANSSKFKNYWQFPRGGVDGKETFVESATRELWEETGLKNIKVISEAKGTVSYGWVNARRRLIGNVYKHRGQEQHIVFFEFNGTDKDIVLDNRELVDFSWVKVSELKSIFHPELHRIVDIIEAEIPVVKVA